MGATTKSEYNQLEESTLSKVINKIRYPCSEYTIAALDVFCPAYEHIVSVYQGYFSNEIKKVSRKMDDISIPFFKGAIGYASPVYLGMYELPISTKFVIMAAAGTLNVLVNNAAFRFGQKNYSDINFPEKSKEAFIEYFSKKLKKVRIPKKSNKSLESHL